MKKVVLILSIMFIILTFIGVGYVLLNKGQVNAGYSVVPMVLALSCLTLYRSIKDK